MSNCPKCNGQDTIKSGKIKGRQRYHCKTCQYHYTVTQKSDTSSVAWRKLALNLYLEGLGFRSIGRLLGFSHVAVYQWIRAFGEKIETVRTPHSPQIVELDEMHSYVGQKKTIAGSGLLLIDLENAFCMLSQGAGKPKQGSRFGRG